jgi:hypothetical protein
VRIVGETNDEVVLRADTQTGGVFVLTDLYWPTGTPRDGALAEISARTTSSARCTCRTHECAGTAPRDSRGAA